MTNPVARHPSRSGAAHAAAIDDDFVERFAVAGPPDYCVERLGELLEVGLDHLAFVTGSRDADPAQVRLGNETIATEVLPQLR